MSPAALSMPMTASKSLAVANDEDLYEIIDGHRVGLRPMGIFAVWTASLLARLLGNHVDANNLGRAITEALVHLPEPINRDRRPDVAFVSYDRWAKNRRMPPADNAWDVVPNVAVEVVSPNDGASELREKIEEYFRAGVEAVWVVYPSQKKIYVHHSPTHAVGLALHDVLEGGAVVPGFRLPLSGLFPESVESEAGS
jgi:Uma2 family endonuclease